ncbi:hypothetical protein LB505_014366 [Fusarium chuoi]|nr:hypothetical protein LB505_014366 [Fusarium chuoi]
MTAGALVIAGAATCRSFPLMIFGKVTAALGDIATQIAYYRVFAGWFAPGGGFGTTIGLQIGIARIGGFVGSSTANVISKHALRSSQTCAHFSSFSLQRLHTSAFARLLIQLPANRWWRRIRRSISTKSFNCLGSSGRLCFSRWCRQAVPTSILKMPLSLLSIASE